MKKSTWKELLSWILAIGSALLAAFILVTFVFQFTIVIGESMEPTLKNHEVLFVDKISFVFGPPHRGDVVVCKYPVTAGDDEHGSKDNYIKRVVGEPGDIIEIKNNLVYINDDPNLDLWMGDGVLPDMPAQRVKDGHYFVLGDNRSNSLDSEDSIVGQLPEDFIKGKARVILLPLRNLGGIE